MKIVDVHMFLGIATTEDHDLGVSSIHENQPDLIIWSESLFDLRWLKLICSLHLGDGVHAHTEIMTNISSRANKIDFKLWLYCKTDCFQRYTDNAKKTIIGSVTQQ